MCYQKGHRFIIEEGIIAMFSTPILMFDVKDGAEIRELLKQNSLHYNSLVALSFNFSDMVQLLEKLGTPAAWGAFSAVAVAWLRKRESRKLELTFDDGQIKTFFAEGYSADELKELLPRIRTATFIPDEHE
ncbi:MAG: hypothetical protein LBU96_07085 [Yokenella regensburgei]|nr:hypothetical protein [Yokenella regensburgei]